MHTHDYQTRNNNNFSKIQNKTTLPVNKSSVGSNLDITV
jgi:hypothetical protein